MDNLPQYSSELKDPRVDRAREHLPEEILLLAIAAMLKNHKPKLAEKLRERLRHR